MAETPEQDRHTRSSIDPRKQALARALSGKRAEGYQVESQDASQTVVVRSYRRWFGLVRGESREIVTIDDDANAHFQAVDSAPAGARN